MADYVRTGTLYELGLVSLGEQLLKVTFRDAAAIFLKAASTKPTQASLAFIQGSGLESAICTFGLSYHPDRLRETFFAWGSPTL